MQKIAVITALSLAALAGPAAAKDHPGPAGKAKAEHGQATPAQGRQCHVRDRAYVAAGTLADATLTANADGTYDGALTVAVGQANHHARADKGTSHTYTLDHARVNLHGQDPAALVPGARVKLLGRVSMLNARCDQSAFTSATTIRRVNVHAPRTLEPSGDTHTEAPAPTA